MFFFLKKQRKERKNLDAQYSILDEHRVSGIEYQV